MGMYEYFLAEGKKCFSVRITFLSVFNRSGSASLRLFLDDFLKLSSMKTTFKIVFLQAQTKNRHFIYETADSSANFVSN